MGKRSAGLDKFFNVLIQWEQCLCEICEYFVTSIRGDKPQQAAMRTNAILVPSVSTGKAQSTNLNTCSCT